MAPFANRPQPLHRNLSRRQLLSAFAAMGATSVLTGCGASLFRAVTATAATPTTPAPPSTTPPIATPPASTAPAPLIQPVPGGPILSATLAVTSTSIGTLAPDFLGLAYEKQALATPLFSASNAALVRFFQLLGPGVLRLGGVSVDQSVWNSSGPGQTAGQIAPADLAALAGFLRATGWSCIYGINLGGAAVGATTAALAAEEASSAARQLGSALLSFELGNECETYGDQGGFFAGHWTVELFENLWQQFRSAIVAAVPTALFAGPSAASDVYSWSLPFGEYVTNAEISLLTQHYTRGSASNATVEELVTPDTALSSELLELHYGAQSIDVPFRLDACAYDSVGAPGVSNAYAASLWAIDTVFQTALGGGSGINFQAGGQQPSSPLIDSNGTILGAAPIFYGLLLASQAGAGTLLSTQLSAASLNVTAYAVQAASGSLSLVLVNKDASQNLELSVALPQAATSTTSVTLQQMSQLSSGASAPSLSALSGVTLQGATVGNDGTFSPAAPFALTPSGSQLTFYVPALSAVLVQLS